MSYPKVIIDKTKLKQNVDRLVNICTKSKINVVGVTKVFCGMKELAQVYANGGIKILADSRIDNLRKYKDIQVPKMMLRLPMISEAENIVKYSDISLNSELETIREISKHSQKQKKKHNVILMVDLGDLREGIFEENEIYDSVKEILTFKGIKLLGIGTNLTCYGGVIPRSENLNRLINIKNNIESQFGVTLDVISGGNSSSLHLIESKKMPKDINQLRLGESLVLGRETAFGKNISGTNKDVFKMEVEIIELKEKPSVPLGEIGMDAFGNKPTFIDKGMVKRGICAIGKQDIDISDIEPVDETVSIIGESSDHLILDLSDSDSEYKVGDTITFNVSYGGILKLMTSEYVYKEII